MTYKKQLTIKAVMKILITKLAMLSSAAIFFNSCSSVDTLGRGVKPVTATVAAPKVTSYGALTVPKNTSYVAPTVKKVVPKNYVPPLSSNIGGNKKVTWSRGNVSGKYVALTFDDGPVSSNTTRLLNMLKLRNIKATFYVIGSRVKNNPSLMKRMVAEGHEVGNHTWTHGKLTNMSDSAVRSELDRTRAAIISATGVKPRTMRPPYGALSTRQRNWIFNEYGYPTILWDVDPEDWKKPGTSVIRSRIVNNTKNGSIILLHDLHKSSVDAVPSTLDALLRKGYKFVTVSQLIALSR